ncbi:hypothetical protein L21TH_1764 [Caldisalinibacter kiritimatiensis]|uniref:Uncharacterized protein n=1 Tax=Caldisalinibacter kiritimatiensis TaxID=1304284 RepID=R1ASQ2_9FIRM|nr:hypothetical protein L21TH_1764 [Caldisalinibacter kiritimatiensis]
MSFSKLVNNYINMMIESFKKAKKSIIIVMKCLFLNKDVIERKLDKVF